MRITVTLRKSTCTVFCFSVAVYHAPVTDRLEIHLAMEKLYIRKLCEGASAWATDKDAVFSITFLLAGAHMVPVLHSEEALVEWLEMCVDSIYQPGLLMCRVTDWSDKTSTVWFVVYEDAYERLLTGEAVKTTNPEDVISRLCAFRVEWELRMPDCVVRSGVYEAEEVPVF